MSTLIKQLACAAIVSIFSAAAAPAMAADIYDRYGASGSPYDDPRYADIYGHPPPRHAEPRYAPPPPVVVERPPYDQPYGYRDEVAPRDRYGYLRPMRPPLRADDGCMPPREIRRSLRGEGWREFEDLELRGATAVIRARRPNGKPYELEVDRCSGDIVHARPLFDRPVPYAYRDRYDERAYRR